MVLLRSFVSASLILAVCAFASNRAVKGRPIFVSGSAANGILAMYKRLSAQGEVAPEGPGIIDASVTIRESIGGVATTIATQTGSYAVSLRRSARLRFVNDGGSGSLVLETKVLTPTETTALVKALEYIGEHPLVQVERYATSSGDYIVMIVPHPDYDYVGIGWPPSPALGVTAIGCNPRRDFQYIPSSNKLEEIAPACP